MERVALEFFYDFLAHIGIINGMEKRCQASGARPCRQQRIEKRSRGGVRRDIEINVGSGLVCMHDQFQRGFERAPRLSPDCLQVADLDGNFGFSRNAYDFVDTSQKPHAFVPEVYFQYCARSAQNLCNVNNLLRGGNALVAVGEAKRHAKTPLSRALHNQVSHFLAFVKVELADLVVNQAAA